MSTRDKIKLLAIGLPVGCSIQEICPVCNGGMNKDKSLSITRTTEGLLYNCFRAKCSGCRGFVSSLDITGELDYGNKSSVERNKCRRRRW